MLFCRCIDFFQFVTIWHFYPFLSVKTSRFVVIIDINRLLTLYPYYSSSIQAIKKTPRVKRCATGSKLMREMRLFFSVILREITYDTTYVPASSIVTNATSPSISWPGADQSVIPILASDMTVPIHESSEGGIGRAKRTNKRMMYVLCFFKGSLHLVCASSEHHFYEIPFQYPFQPKANHRLFPFSQTSIFSHPFQSAFGQQLALKKITISSHCSA